MKLYTWKTPNGYKPAIMLEELGLEYEIVPVNIQKRAQMTPEFLAMNPNHKIPVLVDGELTIFESGAILIYLVEKSGKFQPKDLKEKYSVMEWLMFQMASVGPMFGQANHFVKYAPEKIDYAINRYLDEVKRLMGVLETRLSQAPYLGGEYGIADIATWPWIRTAKTNGNTDLAQFPNVKKWYEAIEQRGAVKRALEKVDAVCA
jgi:GSH-dependent disulfide-bond oxidoreductase